MRHLPGNKWSAQTWRAQRATGRLAIAGALCALCLAGPIRADGPKAADPAPEPAQHSNSWWSWWPWGGGVSYGDGPDRVIGSDRLLHQRRTISAAHAIELRGPIDIVLKQGPVEQVTLHTDDNIAALIETKVEAGILRIGVQPGASFQSRHTVGATVELARLDSLKVLGPGDVTCAQFETDLLEITLRGSGDVRIDALRAGAVAVLVQGSGDVHLSGTAAKQGYVLEGSGDVSAAELSGRDVAVRVVGSGDASVWATDTLSVEIIGSGDVSYHGQPAVTRSVHGSGDIIHTR